MGGYDVKKNEACFRAAWKNVVALCVFLWEEDGLTEKEIIGHAEGHGQGIASNHADPLHWFPKHGESMGNSTTGLTQWFFLISVLCNLHLGNLHFYRKLLYLYAKNKENRTPKKA